MTGKRGPVHVTIPQDLQEAMVDDDILDRYGIGENSLPLTVSGDLGQSLGAPVGRGDVLFEVAPLEAFRVVLEVDESDVRDIREGQRGSLILTSAPQQALPFEVRTVTPISTSEEGRNFFRVESELLEPPGDLRPGMEGVGKVTIGSRRLVWIWTHDLLDRLRLLFWSWLP